MFIGVVTVVVVVLVVVVCLCRCNTQNRQHLASARADAALRGLYDEHGPPRSSTIPIHAVPPPAYKPGAIALYNISAQYDDEVEGAVL